MGSFSIGHWVVVLAIVLILFGAGKLPKVMGDLAKGIKSFKAGMQDDEHEGSGGASVAKRAAASPVPTSEKSSA